MMADETRIDAVPWDAAAVYATRRDDESALDGLLAAAFDQLFEEHAEQAHAYLERALLLAAFRYCRFNQVHTAALLGLSRNVTRAKLKRVGALRAGTRG